MKAYFLSYSLLWHLLHVPSEVCVLDQSSTQQCKSQPLKIIKHFIYASIIEQFRIMTYSEQTNKQTVCHYFQIPGMSPIDIHGQ